MKAIIGNSDGPTAIFLAGRLGSGFGIVIGIILLVAVIILGIYIKKKRKKKDEL